MWPFKRKKKVEKKPVRDERRTYSGSEQQRDPVLSVLSDPLHPLNPMGPFSVWSHDEGPSHSHSNESHHGSSDPFDFGSSDSKFLR